MAARRQRARVRTLPCSRDAPHSPSASKRALQGPGENEQRDSNAKSQGLPSKARGHAWPAAPQPYKSPLFRAASRCHHSSAPAAAAGASCRGAPAAPPPSCHVSSDLEMQPASCLTLRAHHQVGLGDALALLLPELLPALLEAQGCARGGAGRAQRGPVRLEFARARQGWACSPASDRDSQAGRHARLQAPERRTHREDTCSAASQSPLHHARRAGLHCRARAHPPA